MISASNSSTTIYHAENVEEDIKKVVKNLKANKFEWPNEAGFEGLMEHRGPIELVIQGDIPAWAAGTLYRTGPGGCSVEDTKKGTFQISHWFDGLARTHKFDIISEVENQNEATDQPNIIPVRVQYSSRRQTDEVERDIRAAGKFPAISFGQRADPCLGMFSKFMSIFTRNTLYNNIAVTVNANVTALSKITKSEGILRDTVSHGHRAIPSTVFLGTDTAWVSEIDPSTLETLGPVHQQRLHPSLKGQTGPAHAIVCPETGDYISFNQEIGLYSSYRIFKVSHATRETTVLATIQDTTAYIHSFFVTRNYIILCIPVAYYDGVKAIWYGSLLESLRPFNENENCKWFVVDRIHGKGLVGEFFTPAAFFFHSVNSWEEENGDIICEMVKHVNTSSIFSLYYDILLNRNNRSKEFWNTNRNAESKPPHLARYRLSKAGFRSGGHQTNLPSAGTLEQDIPGPHAGELPTINPAYTFRKHHYTYCLISHGLSTLYDSIGKVDAETQDVLTWCGGKGHTPGEAIFVARPCGSGGTLDQAEDDGVLLSVVLDGTKGASYLVCLDAKIMKELGRASCDFPVGFGFHGLHIQD